MEDASLTIVCTRPGLIRAGRAHPHVARHVITDFSTAELREMLAEPALTLVLGDLLTEAEVGVMEFEARARTKKGR